MKRTVPGLLIAGFWLLLLLKGSLLLFCLVVTTVVLLAAAEYVKMVDRRQLAGGERWLLCGIVSFPVIWACIWPSLAMLPLGLLLSFSIITAYCFYRYTEIEDSYGLFTRFGFGILYIGLLGSHVVLLRFLPEGGSWLIIASAVTASSDSGAYFVGRAWGKRKLCPNISPKKTVEGAFGGVISGLIAAVLFALLLLPDVSWLFLLCTAIGLGLVGIAGDLTESIIKRGTDTKDSGNILAGHGGILDRVDSLLFVCPVLYYLLVLPGV
jgi:phosphatidate cytidylyltransferase